MQNEARMAITTTLYDLISALQTQVDSDDDEVISALVVHLLRTGCMTSPQSLNTQLVA